MILVTGASGTVGSEVVKALGGSGARVRAGYRTRPQNIPRRVESVGPRLRPAGDRGRRARWAWRRVFLLSNMVDPERKVVDEAKRAGVKRIVKLSVYGAAEEGFTFARWHRAVEKHIEASGLAWTFLRPAGFMQNFFNYMGETIRKQSAFYTATGTTGAGAHIDARDIGAAAARVLTGTGARRQGLRADGAAGHHLRPGGARSCPGRWAGRSSTWPSPPSSSSRARWPWACRSRTSDALVDLDRAYSTGTLTTVTPDGQAADRPRSDPLRAVREGLRGQVPTDVGGITPGSAARPSSFGRPRPLHPGLGLAS